MDIKSFLKRNWSYIKEERICIKAVKSILNESNMLACDNFVIYLDNKQVITTRAEVILFIRSKLGYSFEYKVNYLKNNLTYIKKADYIQMSNISEDYYRMLKFLVRSN